MAQQQEQIKGKEHYFRGKTLDELKALDVRESAKFLNSRSRRSVLRNFHEIEKFVKRCEKKYSRNKRIRTHFRDLIIVPKLVGLTVDVHNGRNFQPVPITLEMIGHTLGEFAPTRRIAKHTSVGIGATKSTRAQKK